MPLNSTIEGDILELKRSEVKWSEVKWGEAQWSEVKGPVKIGVLYLWISNIRN